MPDTVHELRRRVAEAVPLLDDDGNPVTIRCGRETLAILGVPPEDPAEFARQFWEDMARLAVGAALTTGAAAAYPPRP